MAWETMPPDFRALAESVCTPRELDVLRLRAQGMGAGAISSRLGISYPRVGQLRRSADDKIQRARSPEDTTTMTA